jgi:hypothetical protein
MNSATGQRMLVAASASVNATAYVAHKPTAEEIAEAKLGRKLQQMLGGSSTNARPVTFVPPTLTHPPPQQQQQNFVSASAAPAPAPAPVASPTVPNLFSSSDFNQAFAGAVRPVSSSPSSSSSFSSSSSNFYPQPATPRPNVSASSVHQYSPMQQPPQQQQKQNFLTSADLGWSFGPPVKVSQVAHEILKNSRTSALDRKGDMLVTAPAAQQTQADLFRRGSTALRM